MIFIFCYNAFPEHRRCGAGKVAEKKNWNMSMSIDEIKRSMSVVLGHYRLSYRVEVKNYSRIYTCVSRNFYAWRRIQERSHFPDNRKVFGYTLRQAYIAFRDECLRKNGLK